MSLLLTWLKQLTINVCLCSVPYFLPVIVFSIFSAHDHCSASFHICFCYSASLFLCLVLNLSANFSNHTEHPHKHFFLKKPGSSPLYTIALFKTLATWEMVEGEVYEPWSWGLSWMGDYLLSNILWGPIYWTVKWRLKYCQPCPKNSKLEVFVLQGMQSLLSPHFHCPFSWETQMCKAVLEGNREYAGLLGFCFSLSPLHIWLLPLPSLTSFFPSVPSLMCVFELWICVCKRVDSNSMAVWIFKVQIKLDESKIDHSCQITGSNNRANNDQGIGKKMGKLLREKSNLKAELLYSTPATHRLSQTISQKPMQMCGRLCCHFLLAGDSVL